jgi:hypothetical protein
VIEFLKIVISKKRFRRKAFFIPDHPNKNKAVRITYLCSKKSSKFMAGSVQQAPS